MGFNSGFKGLIEFPGKMWGAEFLCLKYRENLK
jgi:hypothetical protein